MAQPILPLFTQYQSISQSTQRSDTPSFHDLAKFQGILQLTCRRALPIFIALPIPSIVKLITHSNPNETFFESPNSSHSLFSSPSNSSCIMKCHIHVLSQDSAKHNVIERKKVNSRSLKSFIESSKRSQPEFKIILRPFQDKWRISDQ